jgi:hypothetical protein
LIVCADARAPNRSGVAVRRDGQQIAERVVCVLLRVAAPDGSLCDAAKGAVRVFVDIARASGDRTNVSGAVVRIGAGHPLGGLRGDLKSAGKKDRSCTDRAFHFKMS